MTCTVQDCDRGIVGRGYCRKHYARWYRSGDPEVCGTPKGAIPAWLKRHASYSGTDCLQWPFHRRKDGIGAAQLAGRHMTAHHAMCIVAHGQPPSSKHVAAHYCGKAQEGCVNPKHLRWATKSENQQDRVAHGTDSFGERNGMAKLNQSKVEEIRRLAGQHTHKWIAEKFGVSRQHVGSLISGRRWGAPT